MWEKRCYEEGIPDEVAHKLLFSGRAPSWKAVAICLLSNDHQFQRLGMRRNETTKGREIERQLVAATKEDAQLKLF